MNHNNNKIGAEVGGGGEGSEGALHVQAGNYSTVRPVDGYREKCGPPDELLNDKLAIFGIAAAAASVVVVVVVVEVVVVVTSKIWCRPSGLSRVT